MSLIIKEIDSHIAWLTVNRPDALNAMNEDVINELESAVKSSINDDSVGVIIITGCIYNTLILIKFHQQN